MATLNVKGFPDDLYAELKDRAEKDGRSLSSEVTQILYEALIRGRAKYTLDDWRGVGAEIWKGIDVEEFIRRERRNW